MPSGKSPIGDFPGLPCFSLAIFAAIIVGCDSGAAADSGSPTASSHRKQRVNVDVLVFLGLVGIADGSIGVQGQSPGGVWGEAPVGGPGAKPYGNEMPVNVMPQHAW